MKIDRREFMAGAGAAVAAAAVPFPATPARGLAFDQFSAVVLNKSSFTLPAARPGTLLTILNGCEQEATIHGGRDIVLLTPNESVDLVNLGGEWAELRENAHHEGP